MALCCQGDHRGEKLFQEAAEGQMAWGPRGAFLGDNNLVRILLGSPRDATTKYMRELRCRESLDDQLTEGEC